MNTLQELKEYTKDLTVLNVEDSAPLLKQLGSFLEKIFKKVYLASDGLEGLDSYKLHLPNIVITDLTMPKLTGHELISNLKKIDPNIKIIIISAHSDAQNLLESIHIGVSDFIPKPIDNKLLQNALLKVSNEIKGISQIDIDKLNNEKDIFKKLNIISKSKVAIEFVNQYRGVPIVHNGYIIDAKNGKITVHVPYIQTLAIKYQKQTVIESDLLDTPIETTLSNIDKNTREIELSNFTELKYSSKKRKLLRVEIDENFVLVVHLKDKKIDSVVHDVSLNSISITINTKELMLKEMDELDLAFGITLFNDKNIGKIEINERIYTKGKVFKVEKNNDGSLNIVLLFELNKVNSTLLERYIHRREIIIINEFKDLRKRYII